MKNSEATFNLTDVCLDSSAVSAVDARGRGMWDMYHILWSLVFHSMLPTQKLCGMSSNNTNCRLE